MDIDQSPVDWINNTLSVLKAVAVTYTVQSSMFDYGTQENDLISNVIVIIIWLLHLIM